MKIFKHPGPKDPAESNRLFALLLLGPALLYDFANRLIRPILQYMAPILFIGIALWLLFGMFLNVGLDTNAVSNTLTALLVALGSLSFGWADAIGPEDEDFTMIIGVAKQFMHSAVAMILATGFKFFVIKVRLAEILPLDGRLVGAIVWVVMAILFGQSLMQATLPILRLYSYLNRATNFLPGLTLIKQHMPDFHHWLESRRMGRGGRHATGGTAEPVA